jgi:DDE family transposase
MAARRVRRDRQPIRENLRKRRSARIDAGKKIMGRKRHIVTDTQGHLVGVVIHAADIQDRDGAPLALSSIRSAYPWLRHVFADGGYAGQTRAGPCWTRRLDRRNRYAPERGQRFRAHRAPMAGRAYLRLVRPLPPPRQRLRSHDRKRSPVDTCRPYQALDPQAGEALNPMTFFMSQTISLNLGRPIAPRSTHPLKRGRIFCAQGSRGLLRT